MKYSFYCLPIKQTVKAKVTGVVKNKSYGIKGEHRHKGKTYNCHKICSKAEAERVSKETGLDIQYADMEAKASETHTMPDGTEMQGATHEETPVVEEVAMLGDDTFQPDGNGRVIGSNSASMTTATPGTDAVVTVNATPFNSEDLARDSCCCGATKEKPCACMEQGVMDHMGWQMPCSAKAPMCPCYEALAQNKGAETDSISEDMETFELTKPLFSRLTSHADWDDMVSEGTVKIFRDNDLVQVSASGPFADDLLDMIIECHEFPMLDNDTYIDDRFLFESENNPIRKNALMFTGFGALGLISAILIYKQFKK